MKILNVEGVKTISKSRQESISGGTIELYMCWSDCMKVMTGDSGSYQEKSEYCEIFCTD